MGTFPLHNPPKDCLTCLHRHEGRLCNLPAEALGEFKRIGIFSDHARGDKLFSEGESAGDVFIVCFGQVKISVGSRDGKTMILKIADPGDVLGLSAVLAKVSYEATAEEIEPCQVKTMSRQVLLDFLERNGIACMNAARALSDEYLDAFHNAQRLALPSSAAGKLARLLLDWGQTGNDGHPETRFTMAWTHEEIGNMIGMSRETVTRFLSQFRRNQWIRIHGASITSVKPDQLERLAA